MLRLLADDLTGALDTAAEFAALAGPVPVRWDGVASGDGSLAITTGTREAGRAAAIARVAAAAPLLAGAGIAVKKLDSLLRGHVAAELAACLAGGAWPRVVLAPAFPAQGRVTRGGVVLARDAAGGFAPVAPPLAALLAAEGLPCRAGDPAAPLPPGLSVFDAEDDADLARIVACGRAAPGPVLWCGSGGLARALAAAAPVAPDAALRAPVLGLLGSDEPATARQWAACGALALRLEDPRDVARALAARGAALVMPDLPPGLAREAAAERIAASFAALLRFLPLPGTLLVAGGETLAAVCAALGVRAIEARGIVQPGVPRGVLRGGAWDGVALVSKSGAFGGDGLWRELLARNGLTAEFDVA
jgi:uncharacterized protein YgbK (DUF1537 family)